MERVATYRPALAEALGKKPDAAAQKLLAAAKAGEWAVFSAARPEGPAKGRTIPAALIRFLLLGGDTDNPVHPRGVTLRGAWVSGQLNFESCETHLDLWMEACGFAETPTFRDAHLGGLFLPGCAVPGLDLHRLRTEGDVHLRDRFRSTGTVDLGGARIGGQLSCTGGRFDGAEGAALNGNAMTVRAGVFLATRDKAAPFHATGEVNLVGARIGGQLSCVGGRFDGAGGRALTGNAMTVGADVFLYTQDKAAPFHATGAVDFRRARIEGNLTCGGARFDGAFDGEAMRVGATFAWLGIEGEIAFLDLIDARAGKLRDDAGSWAAVKALSLSDFRYEGIEEGMSLGERLRWVDRSQPMRVAAPGAAAFDPQPWSQLARVFTMQGRRRAAARVMEARERRLAEAERARARQRVGDEMAAAGKRLARQDAVGRTAVWIARQGKLVPTRAAFAWSQVFRASFGYGHAPMRALVWVGGIVGLCWVIFAQVFAAGQMAPNSDVVLTSADWLRAVAAGCPLPSDPGFAAAWQEGCAMPLALWAGDGAAIPPMPSARDYETFHAGLNALDLFLPLDALGQEAAWAPSKDRGGWGLVGYYVRMPAQLMGWLFVAVGAAVLTGLLGRKE